MIKKFLLISFIVIPLNAGKFLLFKSAKDFLDISISIHESLKYEGIIPCRWDADYRARYILGEVWHNNVIAQKNNKPTEWAKPIDETYTFLMPIIYNDFLYNFIVECLKIRNFKTAQLIVESCLRYYELEIEAFAAFSSWKKNVCEQHLESLDKIRGTSWPPTISPELLQVSQKINTIGQKELAVKRLLDIFQKHYPNFVEYLREMPRDIQRSHCKNNFDLILTYDKDVVLTLAASVKDVYLTMLSATGYPNFEIARKLVGNNCSCLWQNDPMNQSMGHITLTQLQKYSLNCILAADKLLCHEQDIKTYMLPVITYECLNEVLKILVDGEYSLTE